jgi:hypothetical protein
VQQKAEYASQRALVFRNFDYLMITFRMLRKDYVYLAKCLVLIGDQRRLTLEEREAMLRLKTKRFTEEEIRKLFKG